MAKPRPLRVPSDDCAVTVNGEVCYPNEGEWVEIIAIQPSVADQKSAIELQQLGPALEGAENDPAEQERLLPQIRAAMERTCRTLLQRIVAWSWTDLRGRPLPPIGDDSSVFDTLTQEEVAYLFRVVSGQTPAQRKNA